jgi:hypothetical protein
MNKLKKYRVGVYFEEGQVLTVEAESKEAAEKIAMDALTTTAGQNTPRSSIRTAYIVNFL